MISQVLVYYQGWGENWHWGTLHETTSLTGRPTINQKVLLKLGMEEAELSQQQVMEMIQKHCDVASKLAQQAQNVVPGKITQATLKTMTQRIDKNIKSFY